MATIITIWQFLSSSLPGDLSWWWHKLTPSSLAQWVGAVATSAAVVVALFKDQLLHRFRKPKLAIRISPEPPDCVFSPMRARDGHGKVVWTGKAYWLRLWVQNGGKEPAKEVQVFVSKLHKWGANNKYNPVREFMPMNLRWSNGRDWSNPEVFASRITRKPIGKHCDLCSISDPANPMDQFEGFKGRCVGSLTLEVQPGSGIHRLPPEDYLIELIVAASNADPVSAYLKLNIKGPWSDDPDVMFRDHLAVEIVSKPPDILENAE
jgi:hypothetical protein